MSLAPCWSEVWQPRSPSRVLKLKTLYQLSLEAGLNPPIILAQPELHAPTGSHAGRNSLPPGVRPGGPGPPLQCDSILAGWDRERTLIRLAV